MSCWIGRSFKRYQPEVVCGGSKDIADTDRRIALTIDVKLSNAYASRAVIRMRSGIDLVWRGREKPNMGEMPGHVHFYR